jgi:hypothetical protein
VLGVDKSASVSRQHDTLDGNRITRRRMAQAVMLHFLLALPNTMSSEERFNAELVADRRSQVIITPPYCGIWNIIWIGDFSIHRKTDFRTTKSTQHGPSVPDDG